MTKILPQFKDDTDRLITLAMIICSIFFIFIPALIVLFVPKNYISESTYAIAKAFFNFELLLAIISLFFFVPIIGWIAGAILGPILMICNVIVVLINVLALAGNKELSIPVLFKFI